MLFPCSRRFVTALAISIALHAALFLLPGEDRGVQKIAEQSSLQVSLSLSVQDSASTGNITPLKQEKSFTVNSTSVDNSASNLLSESESRYFLYHELDKSADFVHSELVGTLDSVNSSNEKGRVKVRVLINEFGKVDSVGVLEAEPTNIFNGVALNALLNSRFSPAEKNGIKVKSQKILEIKYGSQNEK